MGLAASAVPRWVLHPRHWLLRLSEELAFHTPSALEAACPLRYQVLFLAGFAGGKKTHPKSELACRYSGALVRRGNMAMIIAHQYVIRRAAGAVDYDKHSCHSSRPISTSWYIHIMGALIAAIICKGEDIRNQFRSDADQPDKSPAPIFNPAARVVLSLLASDWSKWDPLSGGFRRQYPASRKQRLRFTG